MRDVIRVKSVRFHNEGDDVGYIRITQFNEQTTDGLKKAISDLTSEFGSDKIKGFVIDLRNNPGGLLGSGDFGLGCLPGQGRDRLHPRP